MTAAVLIGLFLALGYAATAAFGPAMMPPPPEILRHLADLILSGDILAEGVRTFARGLAGVLAANLLGIALGLSAGLFRPATRLFRPVLTALNACPPVVWISFAMVWLGSGGAVPVFVVAAATLPPVFLAVAEGVRAIDPRLAAMSRLYRVPPTRRLRGLVLPSVFPFWRASFAYTAAAAWKVAAVAEFLGSADGIGARIFWAYRRLDMADLYAWTIAIVAFGVAVDAGIARLRHGTSTPPGAMEMPR